MRPPQCIADDHLIEAVPRDGGTNGEPTQEQREHRVCQPAKYWPQTVLRPIGRQ